MAQLHHLLLLLFLCTIPAESADPLGEFCNTDTNISSSSPISANIGQLLPQLVSGASLNGFISTSYGKAKNQLYGLAQCRGDISSNDCSSCIQDAAKEIRKRCPNQADARIWYDYCFLRYTTNDFFGELDTSVGIFYSNVEDVTDPETFNKKLGALMDEINSEAVVPAIANKGLGKGKTKVPPFVTIYALVQCTRDLSQLSCAQCLATATGNFPNICNNKKGCRVLYKSADPLGEFCNKDTNISSSSPISANIDRLLPQLVSGASLNGFVATSYGKAEDQLYGLAQCRGDISSNDCSSCINDAAKEIRIRCPNQADARIWYDYCFLRYSTKDFFGEVDTSFGIFYYNVEDVTDPETFNKELGALMDQINSQAVVPANKGLGKGKTKLSPFVTLYALVQCTRDLSQLSCAQCLAIAIGNFPNFCNNKKGCRVLYSSCYVRYELYPFFFPLDSQKSLANTSMANYRSIVSKP
ncbi:hypothetical protein F0562_002238 [Nyssa sinensis]|uniref:Gnk2-homologous domain-containing protein n=1 Tax=Nyssa sinensis TaxID=561372 RepID=A0A5J5C6T8_9ASTE|nr:hypothetical protein F0562_002238 [Nyssa sinensis]